MAACGIKRLEPIRRGPTCIPAICFYHRTDYHEDTGPRLPGELAVLLRRFSSGSDHSPRDPESSPRALALTHRRATGIALAFPIN